MAALLAERRVPDLSADGVALRHDGEGALDATAFLSRDVLSGLVLWIAQALGREREAQVEADLLLGVAPPLSGRAVVVEVAHARGRTTIRRRRGCCLDYRREGSDGTACIDCGHTSEDERRRRLGGARNRLRLDLRGADAGAGCP